MATAEQDGQTTGSNLSCKYTKVDYKGRPPFKRRTVTGKCIEQVDLTRAEEISRDIFLKKQHRKRGHPTTRKR